MEGERSYITPEEAYRTGYIEGREDLYETKVLFAESNEQPAHNVLVLSRDPGSAACLIPVMRELSSDARLSIITDGRGEEAIRASFAVQERSISASLEADSKIEKPDLILASAAEIGGLETYANATFEEVPMVLVEDYPGSTHKFIDACLTRPGLHLPDKICVMDEAAKELMLDRFLHSDEIKNRIEVTGQPAFDRIAKEDIDKISRATREKLGLDEETKIVAFMATLVPYGQMEKVFTAMKGSASEYMLIFRRHPRDNSSYEEYFALFDRLGLKYVDSRDVTTDEVSAAADVVLTTWSTAGIEAIYRGKPTMHVLDWNVIERPSDLELPLPVVRLGASRAIDDVGRLSEEIDALLDQDSPLFIELRQRMGQHYPNDGQNSQRVAKVVEVLLGHA